MKISAAAAAFALGVLVAGAVRAEDGVQIVKPDAAARAARAQECEKQAEAKELHLKERKKFISECKKGS